MSFGSGSCFLLFIDVAPMSSHGTESEYVSMQHTIVAPPVTAFWMVKEVPFFCSVVAADVTHFWFGREMSTHNANWPIRLSYKPYTIINDRVCSGEPWISACPRMPWEPCLTLMVRMLYTLFANNWKNKYIYSIFDSIRVWRYSISIRFGLKDYYSQAPTRKLRSEALGARNAQHQQLIPYRITQGLSKSERARKREIQDMDKSRRMMRAGRYSCSSFVTWLLWASLARSACVRSLEVRFAIQRGSAAIPIRSMAR